MDFSKESYDATYTKVAEGVYVISATHRPHHKDSMPELNNRAYLFEVETKNDGKHLLMSGMPGTTVVDNVKQLEKDVGLSVKVIVTSGDFHHMSMKGWLDAFPDVTFVHSDLKFPTTRNGKEILSNEDYKKRIVLEKGFEMPSLEKYSDTVRFFGFNQFLLYPDAPFMTASESATESNQKHKSQNIMSYMNNIMSLSCDQPFLASKLLYLYFYPENVFMSEVSNPLCFCHIYLVWFYHVPTKQLVIEHNFNPYMHKKQTAKASPVLRMMMKTNDFSSCAKEKMPVGPKSKEGCKIHCKWVTCPLPVLFFTLDLLSLIKNYQLLVPFCLIKVSKWLKFSVWTSVPSMTTTLIQVFRSALMNPKMIS